MNRNKVAYAWIWSSLEDLHLGFFLSSELHRPYKIFNEILALEKVLKALLLYHSGDKYEKLSEKQSEAVIEDLAKEYGHKIKKMLKESSEYLGDNFFDGLKKDDFDGFSGADMIKAVEAGYMESRYPTLKPIYEYFKIKGLDIYRDPLGSSGVTKFVYTVNKSVLLHLKSNLSLSSVRERFTHTYGHMEETARFINLAFDRDITKYL